MSRRRNLVLLIAGLVLGLAVISIGCAAEKATPTATPTNAPVATATPTPATMPGVTPTPTQAVVATPTATSTSTPTAVAKPVVLRFGAHFWSKNEPIDDHWSAHIHGLNFDRPLWVREDGQLMPEVATKWESVDPQTWRFYLRKDVKFHDGTPLTAHDAKFSVDEVLKRPGSLLRYILPVKAAVVVDDYTIDIKTDSLDVSVPARLGYWWLLSKKQVDQVGWDGFRKAPLGSGPWRWTEWVAWDHTFAERAPGEHPVRKVAIDRIELWNVPDTSTGVAALRTGSVDGVSNQFYPEEVQDLEKRGFKVFATSASAVTVTVYPLDACRLARPTCDKRVRQALDWAVDKELIAKELWRGYALPRSQPGFPTHAGYNENIPIHYDPKKAEQLLDEAGFPRGKDGWRFEIRFMNWMAGQPNLMALAMKDMWEKVGIKIDYSKVDISVQLDVLQRKGTDVWPLMMYMGGDSYGDNTAGYFGLCNDPTAKKCTTPYDNKDLYVLQAKAVAEPDPAKRAEITKKAMAILVDDPVNLWSTTVPVFYITTPGWEGIRVHGSAWDANFDNMRKVIK